MSLENNYIDGCILRIVVKNFFCHDHFAVTFKKNVVYVEGNNGTGKSALVTALVVGFGGKAAATNRGSSLSRFIKTGTDSASVSITIKNSGETAYKHEIYGDSITVTHDFNVSGGSTYNIKSHTGKTISNKFQDVQNITVAHNIQVENPISILNQDEARIFLGESSKEKYLFFKKATTFDKTEKYYKEAEDSCKKAETILENKQRAAKEIEAEWVKWNTLHERMLSHSGLEQKKKALENEYYWGEVAELEVEVESARQRQQRCDEDVQRLQAQRDGCDVKATAHLDAQRAELREAEAQRAAAEQRLRAAQRARSEAAAAAQRRDLDVQQLRKKIVREQRKLHDLDAGIRDLQSGAGEAARAELERRVAEGEAALEAARARLATAQHEAEQARLAATQAREASDQADEAVRRHRDRAERARDDLQALRRAGPDALAVFGPKMAELRRLVDADVARGAFSAPPRGPVGAYITLRDERWGSALEHIIGRAMTTFCTTNDRDARTLNAIINKVYGGHNSPDVSYARFLSAAHDVSRSVARAPGLLNALDAVRVTDPVVANYLIDNLALETVLLAPDQDAAMRVTSDAQRVPQHLRRVVTRDCDDFFPAPNYRSYGGRKNPVRYLHRDPAERVRQVEGEVEASQSDERAAAAARDEAAAVRRAADELGRRSERALAERRAAATAAEDRLREARAQLQHHHSPTYEALEVEMKETQEQLQKLKEELERKTGDGAAAGGEAATLEQQMTAAAQELEQAKKQCRTLQERVQKEELSLQDARNQAAVLQQRLVALLAERDAASARHKEAAAQLETKRCSALRLCEPIQNPRSTELVRRLQQQAEARLREGVGTALSRAAVGEQLAAVGAKHGKVKRSLERYRKLIGEMQQVVQQHIRGCYDMQKSIVRNVQAVFESILHLRHMTGSLEVDLGSGHLRVWAAPDGKAAGDTSSMSGGERSYTTVALFMALWECIDLPFFFLDEFDVFMDPVNRNVVMQLLMSHAKEHCGRQFVFFTPQDATLKESDFVDILRLRK